jgi:hypothetical protein
MIEWSIRLGDIMVLLGLGGTMLTLAYRAGRFAETLAAMQSEIVELKDVAKAVTQVLTTVAVQKVELEHMRVDVNELKHGRGFIIPKVSEIS